MSSSVYFSKVPALIVWHRAVKLQVAPGDLRYCMLCAQRVVQQYVHLNRIGSDSVPDFQLSPAYDRQLGARSQDQLSSSTPLGVTEFKYKRNPGEILPSLFLRVESDFHAVVKLTFRRNYEEYALLFTSGFLRGIGKSN